MKKLLAELGDKFQQAIILSLFIIFITGMIGTIANADKFDDGIETGSGKTESLSLASSDDNLIKEKPTPYWMLNSNGYSQRYVNLTGEDRVTRMKQLLDAYGIDSEEYYPSIKAIARIHNVYPEALICIAYADSSLGKHLKTAHNYGNVWNNDRWDKVAFANFEKWFNAIGKTLNNKYLSYIYTIDYLSRYHNKDGKVYATSPENQFINMRNCLSMIHNKEIPENWNFRF